MMAKVFSLLFLLALCFGAAGGKLEQVSAALPQGAAGGVELALSIGGTMCVWSGILEVMDQSGLTEKVSRLLSPVIRGIFGKAAQDKQARQALSQNMAANRHSGRVAGRPALGPNRRQAGSFRCFAADGAQFRFPSADSR